MIHILFCYATQQELFNFIGIFVCIILHYFFFVDIDFNDFFSKTLQNLYNNVWKKYIKPNMILTAFQHLEVTQQELDDSHFFYLYNSI